MSTERHPPSMTTTPTLTPRLVMSGGRLAACSALSCLMGQKGGWVSSTGAPGAGLAGARCRHSLSSLQRAVTWSGVRSSCTDQIFTIRSCTVLACGPERTEDHAGPGPRVEMQAVHDTLRELGQAGGGRGPVHQVHKNSFCCHRSRCLKSYHDGKRKQNCYFFTFYFLKVARKITCCSCILYILSKLHDNLSPKKQIQIKYINICII